MKHKSITETIDDSSTYKSASSFESSNSKDEIIVKKVMLKEYQEIPIYPDEESIESKTRNRLSIPAVAEPTNMLNSMRSTASEMPDTEKGIVQLRV